MKVSEEGKDSNLLVVAAPFAVPLFVFIAFLMVVDGPFPGLHYLLYPVKSVLVAAILAFYWRALPSLRPTKMGASIGIGVVAVVIWIALWPVAVWIDGALGSAWSQVTGATPTVKVPDVGVGPFALYSAGLAWTLFVFRVLGSSLCVPVMEELFWRGFLMRWLIREDFKSVPLGTYQTFSFWVTTIFFASVHGMQWPMALAVGVIYGAWFVKTKSLGDVMLAHGVTNFLLALYCLGADDWHFLCTSSVPK